MFNNQDKGTQNTNRIFNYYYLLIIPLIFKLLQLFTLDAFSGGLGEGWISDIAYHLNRSFTGVMAPDIPFGANWNTGIGKTFYLIHHFFYLIAGVGLFQARLVSYIAGLLLAGCVFYWAYKHVSEKAAVLSGFIFLASPLLTVSLPDARQDMMHCLFAFLSFLLISNALIKNRGALFLLSGFVSGLSVDISLRGVEIVAGVYLMYVIFNRKKLFSPNSLLLITGSIVSLIYWLALNILPIGLDNYIKYHLAAASSDGGSITLRTLLSEFERLLSLFSGRYAVVGAFELLYLSILAGFWFKFRHKYQSAGYLVAWLVIMFAFMSVVEKTAFRTYLLVYLPPLCILAGIALEELFERRKLAALIMSLLILLASSLYQGYLLEKYFYHSFVKKDYNPGEYYGKINASVDTKKGIIGVTSHWYAFKDARYYGGQFYISRVVTILKELNVPGDYKSRKESEKAFLDFLNKRKIEYVVADEYFKPVISAYFGGNELPRKNFALVNTINDQFLGRGVISKKPPYKTEIYKIISYKL
ncbi:MAG: glycosyltransferase family 39 protein [Elusimicrobiota bacterium]